MREYASASLNIIEYAGLYLKKQKQSKTKQKNMNKTKQSAEYARILNVSDAVHSIWPLCKLLSSYRDGDVFGTQSNI